MTAPEPAIEAGLPDPAVNEWVRGSSPAHPRTVRTCLGRDGRWRSTTTDGTTGRDDEEDSVRAGQASDWRQRQDESRRDVLGDLGWAYRVFSGFDVFRRADVGVERIRLLLRRAGAPV
ncbi:MAG: hypothetical protein ACOH16_03260 [Propionibacteriaceae bacterium]